MTRYLVANGLVSFFFSFFGGVMVLRYVGEFIVAVRDVATGASNAATRAAQPPPPPDNGLFTIAGQWTVRYAPLGMVVVPVLVGAFFFALEQCRLHPRLQAAVDKTVGVMEAAATAVTPAWVFALYGWGGLNPSGKNILEYLR